MFANGFDIDGVIHVGGGRVGIRPGPMDVIITGRSFEEKEETEKFLRNNGINNKVFYNDIPYDKKTRESSGIHKAKTLNMLLDKGIKIEYFYEDDFIQKEMILNYGPKDLKIIFVDNPWMGKENARHPVED